jgi:hypothetical protein
MVLGAATLFGSVSGGAAHVLHPVSRASKVAATTPGFWDLESSVASVQTSSGKHRRLKMDAGGVVSNSGRFSGRWGYDIYLTTGRTPDAPPSETHSWSFRQRTAGVAGTQHKANLSIDTRAAMGRFGRLRLTFTPGRRRPESCSSGYGSVVSGSLSGVLIFHSYTP